MFGIKIIKCAKFVMPFCKKTIYYAKNHEKTKNKILWNRIHDKKK